MAQPATKAAVYEVAFARYGETKNTVRFQEQPGEGQPELIGSLYVAKWAAVNVAALTLTVEMGDPNPAACQRVRETQVKREEEKARKAAAAAQ